MTSRHPWGGGEGSSGCWEKDQIGTKEPAVGLQGKVPSGVLLRIDHKRTKGKKKTRKKKKIETWKGQLLSEISLKS